MLEESQVIGHVIEDDIFPVVKDVVVGGQPFRIAELQLSDYFRLVNLAITKSIAFNTNLQTMLLALAMHPEIKDLLFLMSVGNASPKLRARDEVLLIKEIWEVNKDFLLHDLPSMLGDMGMKIPMIPNGAGPTA